MFWHKKEEKAVLPDFPDQEHRALSFPKEEEKDEEQGLIHGLPSFPDSPMNRGFTQAVIKDAVEKPEIKEFPELPEPPQDKRFRAVEMEEWSPTQPSKPLTTETEEWHPSQITPPPSTPLSYPMQPIKEADKIFVRIDKFHAARKTLFSISERLNEIDELIKKIREVRLREEQELSSWEKELNATKARVEEVNTNLFGKEND